jgi:hypothetical protein
MTNKIYRQNIKKLDWKEQINIIFKFIFNVRQVDGKVINESQKLMGYFKEITSNFWLT